MRSPTDLYLLNLRHAAHRAFPPDRAEEIVAEVQNHLEDRVASDVIAGVSRPVAEVDALDGFGDPRALVRRLLNASYETVLSFRAREAGFILILALTGISMAYYYHAARAGVNASAILPVLSTAIFVGMLIAAVSAFWGRRPLTKRFAILAVALALLFGLGRGFSHMDRKTYADEFAAARIAFPYTIGTLPTLSRIALPAARDAERIRLAAAQEDIAQLEAGLTTYRVGKGDLPRELARNGKYLIPRVSARRPAAAMEQQRAFHGASGYLGNNVNLRFQQDALATERKRLASLEAEMNAKSAVLNAGRSENISHVRQLQEVRALQDQQSVLLSRIKQVEAQQIALDQGVWIIRYNQGTASLKDIDRSELTRRPQEGVVEFARRVQNARSAQAAPMASDINVARSAWRNYAPEWLEARRRYAMRKETLIGFYEGAMAWPLRLSPTYALHSFVAVLGYIGLPLLTIDFLCASAGRFFWRLRREIAWRAYTAIR